MAPSPDHSSPSTRLLAALAQHPEGATREVLQVAAGLGAVDVQVVRRALQSLVKAGLVRQEGHTRARRYFPVEQGAEPSPQAPFPLSAEGLHLQSQVQAPLIHRVPVGYRRSFLDGYQPNQTAYLPEPVRQHLQRVGGAPGGGRPAGTYAREILQRLLIDLSWNSSRLEGNTYSLLDTQRLIEQGQAASGKSALEAQMILNHKAAIEFLVEGAEETQLDPHTLRNLHALLSENLLADPGDGGRIRRAPVGIHGTTYLPLEVPQLLEECFLQLLHTAQAIRDPFEQAFFMLVQVLYLQPFVDVNKRTARLAANIPFIKANLCPLSFVDVPVDAYTEGLLAVYELNEVGLLRDVFVWAYERSAARYRALRDSLGEPDPFKLRYREALKQVVAQVVRTAQRGESAQSLIRSFAEAEVPEVDRSRFLAVVETELASLHEGNFSRYRIRPSEFQDWKDRWAP